MKPTVPFRTLALAGVLVAAPLHAQTFGSEHFQLHGYLTQGYADATKLPYIGIPTDGTGDYRSAALQARYGLGRRDQLTVQLAHKRLGSSILNSGESPVEVKWAFFEHKFPGVAVKAGRMPMPRGIYNEVRAVGTLLPFYRAPLSMYSEGQETVEGGSLASTIGLGGFSVDLAGYTGRFTDESSSYPSTGAPIVRRRRMANTFGAQAWLNTPIQGVRVGVGGLRYTRLADSATRTTRGEESRVTASLDADVSRFTLRSEFAHATSSTSRHIAYVQTGARLFGGLSVNAQQELSYSKRFTPTTTTTTLATGEKVTTTTPPVRTRRLQDLAIGANYAVRPNLVIKLEEHQVKGRSFDKYMSSLTPPGESKYFIASVSTSF